jgi:hypothetical protein
LETPSSVIPGSLRVHGVVRAKAFLQFSDLRLKVDIKDLTDAVNIISQLQGKSFKWKNGEQLEESGGKRVIGFIAQEVQRIIPNVVHQDENGYLSVAYAELVPIVIEALKEHLRQYEHEKGDVRVQLEELNHRLEKMQLAIDKAEVEREELRHTPLYYGPVTVSQVGVSDPEKLLQKEQHVMRAYLLRIGIVVLFLVGLAATISGSIFLGITLSQPQKILTTLEEAVNLRPMDQDGVPDPYCVVEVGANLFRSKTYYNTPNPLFDETFTSNYDSSVYSVIFQVYDSNGIGFSDLMMGVAEFVVDGLEEEQRYVEWLDLREDAQGPSSGQLKVAFYITSKQKPGYELAILIIGAVLTVASLVMGFYVWKVQKRT